MSDIIITPVLSTDDVKESILYAQSEGLKVTIASGGHDFLTRNAGNGTLHFNLKHLNQNEIVADSSVPSGAVIRVGAGGHWENIEDQVGRGRGRGRGRGLRERREGEGGGVD